MSNNMMCMGKMYYNNVNVCPNSYTCHSLIGHRNRIQRVSLCLSILNRYNMR